MGCPYYLYDPTGENKVALNVPTDADFIGYVQNITGLDMSGVRENAQVVVAGDGGYHGPFWRDRRPWTITGFIVPSFSVLSRDQAQEKLEGIVGAAMRKDGYLYWNPADSIQKMVPFRAQQPVRVNSGQSNVEKIFNVAAVTADYRIRASSQTTVSFTGQTVGGTSSSPIYADTPVCTNHGNADAACIFTFTNTAGLPNLTIINNVTGKRLSMYNNISPQTVTVDLTGTYPTATGSVSGNLYGKIDPLNTDWDVCVARSDWNPGQTFSLTTPGIGTYEGGTVSLQVAWNDSWL